MVLVTSLLTGLFAGMLRSVFAVIAVAFLIFVTFAIALVFYGASWVALAISIGGFNLGLITFVGTQLFGTGARSA